MTLWPHWAVRAATPIDRQARPRGPRPRTRRPAPRLRPPATDLQPAVLWAAADRSPQDTWYAVEDLLLRLAVRLPVQVHFGDGRWTVTVVGAIECGDAEDHTLVTAACDGASFRWFVGEQRGSFVQAISRADADLTLSMTSAASMAAWPWGEDLGWQLTSLMTRLRTRSRVGQAREPMRGYADDLRRRPRASCSSTCATSSPAAMPSAPAMRSSSASDG